MIDFLIIGGGVAGLSAAANLAPLGITVVLEQEDVLAYHASGRSAALFEENYGAPPVCALTRASRTYMEGTDGGLLSPRGILMVALPGEEDLFASEKALLGLEAVSTREAAAMVPIVHSDTCLAAHSDSAQDIDADRLITSYVKTIKANGGEIRTKTQVEAITRQPQGWLVQTKDQVFEARTLVNAAGPWADGIAHMAQIQTIGLPPLRRSVARIAAPGGHDVSRWPMLFGPGETWYAKPDAGALIVSPANETPSAPMDAWAEDLELAEGLSRYEDHVTTPATRPMSTWAGLRTFAPDKSLVLGPDPRDPDFIWAAGQGGYGIQTSPAAGRLIAAYVAGTKPDLDPEIVQALSPHRFS